MDVQHYSMRTELVRSPGLFRAKLLCHNTFAAPVLGTVCAHSGVPNKTHNGSSVSHYLLRRVRWRLPMQ